MGDIQVSVAGGVCTIRFNRPDKKNALSLNMYQAVADAVAAGESDPAVDVFLLTGGPGCFTSGNDVTGFLAMKTLKGTPQMAMISAIAFATKPIVAAVEGPAVGIGTTILLHCDLVYVAPGTRFHMPFVNLGLVPEAASSLLLPRLAGYQRAAELLMLGEPFDCHKAEAIGLVNAVIPAEALQDTAQAAAAKLAAKPKGALRAAKALLKGDPAVVQAQLEAEEEQFDRHLGSAALKEAVAAFMEKRAPDFSACE